MAMTQEEQLQLKLEAKYSIRTTMREMLTELIRVNAPEAAQRNVISMLGNNEIKLRKKLQEIETKNKNFKSDPEWIYIKKELQEY